MEERQKKTYRNSIRSEKSIIHAYVQLMQNKTSKRITVTDIVNKADLNRSTFYAHFKSAEDVRERIQKDVLKELLGSLDKNDYKLNYIILGCSIIILLILTLVLFFYIHRNITTRITNISNQWAARFRARG